MQDFRGILFVKYWNFDPPQTGRNKSDITRTIFYYISADINASRLDF